MMSPMEALQSALRAGDRLDRYELLCPIASGGMATVWLARLRGKGGFEKLFAIKTIRTELVDDPRFQEMLLDEARIASNIQHPNVAQIFDVGEAREVLFIVMERVDGESLAKIRKLLAKLGAKLPLGIALRVLADAAAGLHAAHELCDESGQPLGIVHRDVSPHNILVSRFGRVKVIDFGIAKAQNRQQGETRTGIVKGKVQYMAPEQIKKGRSVDRRADIWALGVCLHELVTGRVPNDGDDHIEVIRKVLADEAPPVESGLPDAIALILSKSVALEPDARYPTAAAMQRALEGAMRELGESATSDDIAAFLRTELPELEEHSRAAVARSIEEARERGLQDSTPGEDVAFAPTMIGQRDGGAPSQETRPVTRPRARSGGFTPPYGENERAEFEAEDIKIPKHSRAWLWLLLLLALSSAGARIGWPKQTSRLLAKVTAVLPWASSVNPPAASSAEAPPAAQPAASSSATPPSSASGLLGSPSSSASAHLRPGAKPSPSHLSLSDASAPALSASPSAGASTPTLAPSAAASTPATPAPSASAAAPAPAEPQPASSATVRPEDDASTPYGN